MKVDDIMIDRVITVYAGAKVKKAVQLMNTYSVGCLIVQEKGKPVGIVTERDLMRKVLAKLRNPEEIQVREIMSSPLICGNKEMKVEDAIKIMLDKKIKKLPIIEKGRLIGMVSLADLLHFQSETIELAKEMTAVKHTLESMMKTVEYAIDLPTHPLPTDYVSTKKLRE